jgi:phosphoglycerate dehydrogenase-like enzyme
VGGDLRRCPTGLCRVVPVALAGASLRRVSTMTNNRTILITGVTGKQGGAVAQALRGAGFHLRGLTRKPESAQAAAARAPRHRHRRRRSR